MSKRKRVVLSLKDKINIIECLKNGESGCMLAEKYRVGTSTISDIKKNSDSILKFNRTLDLESGNFQRKVMKKPQNKLLEDAVFAWFLQKRACGQPVSGPALCEKALDFNQKLGGSASFKASSGWLARFKSRHGIRDLEIQGDKMSARVASADSFAEGLKVFLEESGYDMDFVYNADETSLYWKALPSKSLASRPENAASEYMSEDKVTLMVCANANGTHRMPLLLIGKSKNPRCFKDVKIPITYRNQRKAWMNTDIFLTWYDETFIPEIKKYQKEIGKQGDVVLLLDNAPSHPSAESLMREKGKFTVMFLPANVSSILQPMGQGVIETLKRFYRKHLLQHLLSADDGDTEKMLTFFKRINLKDCCYMLVEAWNSVESQTLIRSWNKLLKVTLLDSWNESNEKDFKEITETVKAISICDGCDEENINDWLSCDSTDLGFQILTDEEIIADLNCIKIKEEIEDESEDIVPDTPSHAEAFEALETAFKWFERQDESDPLQLLQLKQIRDLAAAKRLKEMQE